MQKIKSAGESKCAQKENKSARENKSAQKMRGASVFFLIVLVAVTFFGFSCFEKPAAESYAATSATSMITIERDTNRVLFSKNADQKRPMASTTKVVTAITVLENVKNLDRIVRVPKEAVGVEGSSIYLQANEPLSIRDLLYGLMLQSGNDCAVSLACAVSGSVEKFAEEMNKLAKKVGANNSNFVNPHGLHHDKHYTTARDLALISSYALKNADFRQIVSTKRYSAPWQGRDYNRNILNKNKLLASYQGATGIKTGYTKRAGRCLVASASRAGMEVVTVVLNCGPMFEECSALMDKAFDLYVMSDILLQNSEICQTKVEKSRQATVKIGCLKDCTYPLTKDEKARLRFEIDTPDFLKAPVRFGTEVGTIKIYLDNQLLFDEKLYTIEEAESLSVTDHLKDLVDKWNAA